LILWQEGATKAQEDEAEDILTILTMAYPGHPWGVRVYDGGFFIRHLAFDKNWGMNCRFKEVGHDWAVMRKQIIIMAGEWLERAGLPRGRYDPDQEITHLEGAPKQDQPHQPLENVKIVLNESQLRDTPRPQALKASDGLS
jgi:hypothetical protein